MDKVFKARVKAVRKRLIGNKIGALFVTDMHEISYLSGFSGSSA